MENDFKLIFFFYFHKNLHSFELFPFQWYHLRNGCTQWLLKFMKHITLVLLWRFLLQILWVAQVLILVKQGKRKHLFFIEHKGLKLFIHILLRNCFGDKKQCPSFFKYLFRDICASISTFKTLALLCNNIVYITKI